MEEIEQIEWKTPRSWFPQESQRAFDKYDACSGNLVAFTEKELDALYSHPHFEEAIKSERQRRKEANELAMRRAQAPAATPRRPALTKAVMEAISTAMAKALKNGDTASLHKAFRTYSDTARYPGSLVTQIIEACVGVLFHAAHATTLKHREHNTQIAALEARITGMEGALESRPTEKGLSYEGVWSGLTTYAKNAAVTYDGSIWIAREANVSSRPSGGGPWTLAVKHGEHGKDGRPGKDLR